jgi:hypothetical protein
MFVIKLLPLQQYQNPEEGINFTNEVAVRNHGAYHWVSVILNSVKMPYIKPDAPGIGAAQYVVTPLSPLEEMTLTTTAKKNEGLPRKSRKNRSNRKNRRNTRRH